MPSIPDTHIESLRLIIERIGSARVDWVVTGSTGMALQGAPFEPHDIDLQTNVRGAYTLGSILHDWVITPVRYVATDRIRSHLGEYHVAGVTVEVMGGIEKCVGGVWEVPADVKRYRQWTEVAGLNIPVLDLWYEYRAYLAMGRLEKAEKLRDWLFATQDATYPDGE